MKKIFRHTIYFIIIFLTAGISFAQTSTIKGKVISIADGDTITVLQENKQHKIRRTRDDMP